LSKITNDDLILSGTGWFIAVPCGNSGRQRVNCFTLISLHVHSVAGWHCSHLHCSRTWLCALAANSLEL